MLEDIKAELTGQIDSAIVDEVLAHHSALKTAFRLQDWEKCLLRGGKFSEAVMKVIHFIRTGKVRRQIAVDSEINEVSKWSDLPESIRLLIPRAVRVMYDHRSRRGGAHSSFDPNPMDCALVVSTADWVLGELVHVFCTADPEAAMKFVTAVTSKSIPIVEKIGEDYVVLLKGASARQEIGYILYVNYPNRIRTTQLIRWIPIHSPANIRSSLSYMERIKLAHCNSDGAVLTTKGIKTVEEELSEE